MKKATIKIKNVGPISSVDITLNKVNIFMGAQSCGKSTISKIISFCNWVEKDVAIHQSLDDYNSNKNHFIEKLESFHKMKNYFNSKSEIEYLSDTVKIHYTWEDFEISWIDRLAYKKNKISYIPSERNIATLPEMEKVELGNNYLKSFLYDWFDARKNCPKESNMPILDVDVKYYYSENTKENHIVSTNDSYDILLSQASSGLQSVTPLVVMIDNLINNIYLKDEELSYELDQVKTRVSKKLLEKLVIDKYVFDILGEKKLDKEKRNEVIDQISKRLSEKDEKILLMFKEYEFLKDNLFKIQSTNLIIEEPELNLFPSTQKALIYYLLKSINSKKDHRLSLTTHSPYVLYAINNCIMASIVNNKLSDKEKAKLACLDSQINPDSISVYEIKDGLLNCIQEKDGSIGKNFFDSQMKEVMDEFYVMLNHY